MKKLVLLIALSASFTSGAQTLIYHSNFVGNANDLSGNGYHGTVNGATLWPGQSGVSNTAYRFDGINDFIQLPTNTAFNLNTWTLQALIKVSDFYSGICQANSLIWHGSQFSSSHYSLVFGDNYYDLSCAANTTQEAFGGNAAGSSATPDFQSSWYTSNGFIDTNTWYCVTATYDSSVLRLYVDGTLVESGFWTYQYNYGTGAGSALPTFIGKSNDASYPYWFNGIIDQVSIWRGAMGSTNIQTYCDSSHAGSWKQGHPSLNTESSIGRQDFKVNVFPSQASDKVTLEIGDNWKGATIYIMNGVGQVVTTLSPTADKSTIDVSNLPIGIYMIKVVSEGSMSTAKFMKE